ncbi:MAG: UDP-N-acetylmuramate--alanine ligase [Patiriisocius sp.]|jgi:UDP-N-acetylmuramate--alanine ligase
MKLKDWKHIYFIGIGGIGMSALARYFHEKGYSVSGYDKVKTKLTEELTSEGISIIYKDSVEEIPESVCNTPNKSLVVYTPAIPEDNKIHNYFKEKQYLVIKRAKLLALVSEETHSLAVAGTHGKTTTSSILAHILNSSSQGCNAFLGGIANNYNSNIILNESSNLSVLEADEYDRSFLNLSPSMAIITSMDPDHLDIYSEKDEFQEGFIEFANKIKPDGILIHHESLGEYFGDIDRRKVSYGISDGSDCQGSNIRAKDGYFVFDVNYRAENITGLNLILPGLHNVENALAAIAMSFELGVSVKEISSSIKSYTGVKRRFQYQFKSEGKFYIDDYAHHPTEIEAVHHAARQLFPGKKITCIFQPHLFSRTKDFMKDFANVLTKFDEIILLDIYPAREKPIPGITSKALLDMIPNANKSLFAKEVILDHIIDKELEVLFTLGAGDIDTLVEPLSLGFAKKYRPINNRN